MYSQAKMQLWYPKQVVDARAGPGMKSMTKFKSKNKKFGDSGPEKVLKKKAHFEREYSPALSDKSEGIQEAEMQDVDFLSESGPSGRSSRTGSPGISDCEENAPIEKRKHKGQAKKREMVPEVSGFVDLDYWKKYVCLDTYKIY